MSASSRKGIRQSIYYMEQFIWIAMAAALVLLGALVGAAAEAVKSRIQKIEYQQEVHRQLLLQQSQATTNKTTVSADDKTKQIPEYTDG